jgi:hypothetical protein
MPRHFANPRIYYRVKPGSPAMAALEKLNDIDDAHRKAVRALLKDLGLPKEMMAFGTDRSIWGISSNPRQAAIDYVAAHPNEWRWDRRTGYGAPRRNTPEGKAIYAKFQALPKGVDGETMNREIVGVGAFFAGLAIVYCGYWHKKGGPAIINMPAAIVAAAKAKSGRSCLGKNTNRVPVLPKGLTEMKTSEALAIMGEMKEPVEA